MTMLQEPRPASAAAEPSADEVADRVLAAALGAFDTLTVYLGDRLGWYRIMAGAGPLSPADLADRSGTNERYAREWLEQQAASEWLVVVEPDAPGGPRRFRLTDPAAEVLTDSSSLAYLAPLTRFVAAAAAQLPALAEAYRSGGGVSWAQFGSDARTGQADMNRPWYERKLAGALRGVPDLHELLDRSGTRIADIGCGEGWSTIALARAYPEATVRGYDPDAPSTAAATEHAGAGGLTDRVAFATADAATALPEAAYDAVFAFECLHDLPRPVEVLTAARRALRPGGVVVVMEEAAEEEFATPAGEVERLLYGFSTLVCLPDAMSHRPSAATGTVIRPGTVRAYAQQAGFAAVAVLPIEGFGFWRFYRLVP
ncbi:class I SAM-dependent methyltransferase [Geodermatophilus sp. YIM 151500]|uniref:class I SAM-dependent methyltransferase n=1 Tax=Geodermatophilus sp. YIM 151500 TaxID=2984531 RepID=UPI0021E3BE41|nr:class I SAM-dependent methyltransferase [Geodermatophilus sp. YIM 151500]MCV2490045.1 class I SAM-dependent methyltransferase [Geodermatophilus sp. YIM 151500]